MRIFLACVVLAPLASLLLQCGSSGGGGGGNFDGGFTGVTPCSAGADAGTEICKLSMPLTGGISETIGAIGCGDINGTELTWQTGGFGKGTLDVSVEADFAMKIPVDQVGTYPVTLQITQATADGGVPDSWQTPTGACSLTIAGSICSPTEVFANRRVLSGSGTCSQPAAPQMGNTGQPIMIGEFQFEGFFNPM
jgi:hypothetical protein